MGLVILRVQLILKPAETHCSELEQLCSAESVLYRQLGLIH